MKQQIHFAKMHGLGNDFIVIDNRDLSLDTKRLDIAALGHRRLGIGFDQLLLVEPSAQADFFCRIFNSDGTEAEQCGNGLRCVARYIHEHQILTNDSFSLETKSGVFPVTIKDYDHIQIAMNTPRVIEPLLTLKDTLASFPLSVLTIGNPHAVTTVNSIEDIDANTIAAEIATLSWFPEGANVGFMQIVSPNHIRLRTIERGAGETPACGSNACAAVTAGIINQQLEHRVRVEYPLGSLLIEWQGNNEPILMTGSATSVFSGTLHTTK